MKCNGISVKWCDGSAASGHLMPMVAIFSGFNEKEMPKETFMVIEVPGMAVNANLDARNIDKGYLILMKQNEDMNKFYEWYDNCIVQPFFRKLLQSYCSILSTDVDSVPESLAGRFGLIQTGDRSTPRIMCHP